MTFISYAQNFEDVILWRALKHIPNGFYIDVGAWSPDIDSVTRAFYENGWHGINIEPNPEFHTKLQEKRPRDINLKIAISDTTGSLEMNFVENPGLSTLNPNVAKTHQENGWEIKTQFVDIKKLSEVWNEYIHLDQEVHFLKIDVEGLEDAVIRSNDWSHNRPWIVVVEATLPLSQVESHHTWEFMLLEVGYHLAYADGLNRFYVAKEHNELLPSFNYPPNVFDSYILASHVDALTRATQAEEQAANANLRASVLRQQYVDALTRATQAEEQAANANLRASVLRQQYDAVLNSRSWKITKPLRQANRFARWFIRGTTAWITLAPGSRPRRGVRKALAWTIRKVQSNPALREKALALVNKFPKLKQRLKLINIAHLQPSLTHEKKHCHMKTDPNTSTGNLSPRARKIYKDLKTAIEIKNQESA